MSDPLPRQNLAFSRMLDLRHPIVAAEHPFSWDKPGFRFLSFETVEEFEKHVQKQKDVAWVNEIVLPYDQPWRDMLGAVGVTLPHPRLCFDIDYEVAGDGNHDEFRVMVEHVKVFAQIVVRRYLHDLDFELEYLEIEGSRATSSKKYKHSVHMVVANVAIENWLDGKWILKAIDEEWKATNPPEHLESLPLDRSVYSRNRGMRVQGSRKKAGTPPLTSDLPFQETLITHYTREDVKLLTVAHFDNVHSSAARILKRKRCMSFNDGSSKRFFGEDNIYVEDLQKWLDTHPVPRSMGWTGATVQEAYTYETCHYIWFKVGFSKKGIPHLCVAGHHHNGNASQTWKIRVDKKTMDMHAACWPNAKWELPCQSQNGELLYLPVKGLKGRQQKLCN